MADQPEPVVESSLASDEGSLRVWPAYLTAVSFSCVPYVQLIASNLDGPLEWDVVAAWWLVTVALSVGIVGGFNYWSGTMAARRAAAFLAPITLL
ncbi:MAG TPA: hypothetical protein VJ978_03130, partial [Nitriliruptoraceae bacterium]|nr:hypothetical protein [Nitriliruptoraceae bacterium]